MPDTSKLQLFFPETGDIAALLAFELESRSHFEQWVTARAASYYTADGIAAAIEQAQREREQDRSHQFLARIDGQIVGRINLTGVTRPYFNKAQLGYRVGAQFGGRGYAKQMMKLLQEQAFGELDLWRLEATVRPPNLGSIAVLQHGGFSQYGQSKNAMRINDAWFDLLYFERRNPRLDR